MRRSLAGLLLLALAAGCATSAPRAPAFVRPVGLFPTDALLAQRATLTVHGRQMTFNGYLSISAAHDLRLVVTETFGRVLADVLVRHDGTAYVMRSSPAFKPAWIRRYVAADLACIYGLGPAGDCPVTELDGTHFRIERGAYTLEVRTVDTRMGPQAAELFDASRAEKP